MPTYWEDEIKREQRVWLVTGAAGFIGSHIVGKLLRLGQRVIGLDDFSTGLSSNLDAVRAEVGEQSWLRFQLTEGDIRSEKTCAQAVEGADIVLHQAALGSVQRSMLEPHATHSVNVDGTVNIFLAAINAEVTKVVYASSSSVYGDDAHLLKVENRTGAPLSPYAASKQTVELYASVYHRSHGLPAVGLRYFNVVGTRQDPAGPYAAVVPRWLAALRSEQRPTVFGDGETSRDFCPVANVVQANLLAAVSAEHTNGSVYNVAVGRTTTLNQLFDLLQQHLVRNGVDCADIRPVYEDFRPGDIQHSRADIAKARADLGYSPLVELESAIREVAGGSGEALPG